MTVDNLGQRRGEQDAVPSVTGKPLRPPVKLNPIERKVLMCLVEAGGHEGFGYCSFKCIEQETQKLEIKEIRRACRSLARKGLVVYGKGLWTEDGEPAGSGYAATTAGEKFIDGTAA